MFYLDLIKKYWLYIALLFAIITMFFIFKKRELNFSDEIKKIRNSNAVEIQSIQHAREKEQLEHSENIKKLQSDLDISQKKYESLLKEIDDNKKITILNITKKYANDPDGLTKKFSEITGILYKE